MCSEVVPPRPSAGCCSLDIRPRTGISDEETPVCEPLTYDCTTILLEHARSIEMPPCRVPSQEERRNAIANANGYSVMGAAQTLSVCTQRVVSTRDWLNDEKREGPKSAQPLNASYHTQDTGCGCCQVVVMQAVRWQLFPTCR